MVKEGDSIQHYIDILKTIQELPFNIGRESLTKLLRGELTDTIAKHDLDLKSYYGVLSSIPDSEIKDHIKHLESHSYVEVKQLPRSQARVVALTMLGKSALKAGKVELGVSKVVSIKNNRTVFPALENSPATDKELSTIVTLQFFLDNLDKEQSHATICDAKHILCVAGAGSGKTTVLTKRIEFLCTFRSVLPHTILAVTFTKKARDEMRHRLDSRPVCAGVHVETFNSLCERLLRQLDPKSCERPVLDYKDKFELVRMAISHTVGSERRAFESYFTPMQLKTKSNEELLGTLTFDIFSIIEHYKNEQKSVEPFYDTISNLKDKTQARLLHALCTLVISYMKQRGIRDYIDQVTDVLALLKGDGTRIPKYSHILVDEFQDTNSLQVQLLDVLGGNTKRDENILRDGSVLRSGNTVSGGNVSNGNVLSGGNVSSIDREGDNRSSNMGSHLFCVGDPRQSIYEWRGSKPSILYDFKTKFTDAKIIHLTTNYRSDQKIVMVANGVITPMNLPNLLASHPAVLAPQLVECDSEEAEWDFITRELEQATVPLHHIFVLARTNKQLSAVSFYLQLKKIGHILKTDEGRHIHLKEGHVTLATIHAIKGLEAEKVYLIGCTNQYFPCKISDHPVLDMLKTYDTEEEERRLFYVGITRAKKELVLSYASKSPTYFLTKEVLAGCKILGLPQPIPSLLRYQHITKTPEQTLKILRDWRNSKASEMSLEKYMILHDKTLQQIATDMPLNTDDLKQISGMGPIKIQKYGEELLMMIKRTV